MPQLNTSDHIHNLNVFVNSILSEYNYYYELVNKCDKATNDYLHQSVLLFKEVSNMKRKKVIHIKSVHRYDHTCSFGEYLYTPVRYALEWFTKKCSQFDIEIVKCKQLHQTELTLVIKGKKTDITRAITAFISANGENFNIK
jgi:hypothetical protein